MKQFMITFKNLRNNRTLDTLFNADRMSEALLSAERLCERFGEHDITLKVTSVCEIDKIVK